MKSAPVVRVVIVDESPLLRRDVRQSIARTGVGGIYDFERGKEALSVLPAVQPAVAIIGHQLEDMSGFTLARKIRGQAQYAGMPLILLSPVGQLEDLMEAVDNGIDDYIVVPFEPEHLAQKIAAALARVPDRKRSGVVLTSPAPTGKGYAHRSLLGRDPD